MKKYPVYAKITGTKYLGTVDANSEEEAEQIVYEKLEVGFSLCHYCSHQINGAEIDGLYFDEEE